MPKSIVITIAITISANGLANTLCERALQKVRSASTADDAMSILNDLYPHFDAESYLSAIREVETKRGSLIAPPAKSIEASQYVAAQQNTEYKILTLIGRITEAAKQQNIEDLTQLEKQLQSYQTQLPVFERMDRSELLASIQRNQASLKALIDVRRNMTSSKVDRLTRQATMYLVGALYTLQRNLHYVNVEFVGNANDRSYILAQYLEKLYNGIADTIGDSIGTLDTTSASDEFIRLMTIVSNRSGTIDLAYRSDEALIEAIDSWYDVASTVTLLDPTIFEMAHFMGFKAADETLKATIDQSMNECAQGHRDACIVANRLQIAHEYLKKSEGEFQIENIDDVWEQQGSRILELMFPEHRRYSLGVLARSQGDDDLVREYRTAMVRWVRVRFAN